MLSPFPLSRMVLFSPLTSHLYLDAKEQKEKFSTLLVALLATKKGGGELYLLSPPSVSTIGWPRSISGVLAWFFTNRLVLVLVRQYVLLLHIGRYKQTVVAVIMWVYYPYHFDLRY